jgi:hypothetical protein
MIEVLTDIHIAESSPQGSGMNQQQTNGVMASRYDTILKKHNITYKEFKTSFDYYMAHPEQLDEIYQEIINRLSTMEGKAKATRVPLKKAR